MRFTRQLAVLISVLAPIGAFAAGGHDSIGCAGCHSLHKAEGGQTIFAVKPNSKYLNPKTKVAYTGSTAFCLACHQDEKNGGQGYAPVSQHLSHPFGLTSVNPKIAKVPPQLMKDGRFECMGCHDPHPSNTNYRYLRVNVGAKGEKIDQFCGVCHASKADRSAGSAQLFDSGDETAPRTAPAAAVQPAAQKKK